MKRQASVGWLALASIFAMATATTLMAADNTEISAKARKEGMEKTPALIQTTGINCTLSEARLIESGSRRSSFAGSTLSMSSGGSSGGGGGGGGGGSPPPNGGGGSSGGGGGGGMSAGSSSSTTQYEVACSEGLGYVISAPKDKAPEAILCLEMDSTNSAPPGGGPSGGPGGPSSGQGGGQNSGMGAGGMPPGGQSSANQSKCLLPGNANQIVGLVPFIAKAGLACSITKARGVGHTATSALFEVACDDNSGYILATTLSPNANKEVQSSSCAELPANSNIRCTLSDPNAALLVADQLMAKSDKACKVTERRIFGGNAAGDKFFEVACEQGTGYVVQQTASGDFGQAVTCADIGTMAGGCQLAGNKK